MIDSKQSNKSYPGVTASMLCFETLGICQNQQLATHSSFENCLQIFLFVIVFTAASPIGLPTVCVLTMLSLCEKQ